MVTVYRRQRSQTTGPVQGRLDPSLNRGPVCGSKESEVVGKCGELRGFMVSHG